MITLHRVLLSSGPTVISTTVIVIGVCVIVQTTRIELSAITLDRPAGRTERRNADSHYSKLVGLSLRRARRAASYCTGASDDHSFIVAPR